jgi:hypothetical protein
MPAVKKLSVFSVSPYIREACVFCLGTSISANQPMAAMEHVPLWKQQLMFF